MTCKLAITAGLGILCFQAPVFAQTVSLDASLNVSCTFVITDGALAADSTYTNLSSENSGGSPALVAVTALGGNPTITFAAPTITSTNDVSGATAQIKYSSLDGASQDYTSAETVSTASDLLDTYTIDAKADDAGGFDAGTYSVSTVVTCSG